MTTSKTTINTNIENNTLNKTKFIVTRNVNKYENNESIKEDNEKAEEMLTNLAYTCSTNKRLADTQCYMLYTLGFGDTGYPINDETIESILGHLAYEHLNSQDNVLDLIKDVILDTIDRFNHYNKDSDNKSREITTYFDSTSSGNEAVLVIECFDNVRKEIIKDALYNFELLIDINISNY